MVRTVILMACFALVAGSVRAEPYPSDMGFINVRSRVAGEPARTLAVGDGIADDTRAFEEAISLGILRLQTVYVPKGMYRITRPLPWRRLVDGKWAGQLSMEGEDRDSTILFLSPDATGFSNPAAPNGMFATSSQGVDGGPQLPTATTPKPGGVAGPLNSFRDLTINTGDFPGAMCIDWVVSNRGSIERVTCIGNGVVGIDASRPFPGPGLIQDVEVRGFDYGVRVGNTQFNIVLRNVVVSGQRLAGVQGTGPSGVHIENLTSINSVPAVLQTSGNNALAVIGLMAMGGSSTRAAVETHALGRWILRDIESSGYRSAVKRGSVFGTDLAVAELSSHPVLMAHPGSPTTLRITAEQEPETFRPLDFARDCARPASSPSDQLDDTVAIQAALDSGKPCVLLPHSLPGVTISEWRINRQLNVPAHVRLIDGGDSFIRPAGFLPQGTPAFLIAEESCEPLTIRRVWGTGGLLGPTSTTPWIDHRARKLLVKNAQLAGGNRGIITRSGAGDLFLVDVFGSFDITDSRLYAWQFNAELSPPFSTAMPKPLFVGNFARNSIVRIVGYKTEQDFVSLDQTGGMAEILGAHLMPGVGTGSLHPVQPTWIVRDGQFAASYKVWSDLVNESPAVHLVHVKNGVSRMIFREQLSRNAGDNKTNDFAPLMVAR